LFLGEAMAIAMVLAIFPTLVWYDFSMALGWVDGWMSGWVDEWMGG